MYAIVGLNDDFRGSKEVVWGIGATADAAWTDARVWIAEYADCPLHAAEEQTAVFNAEIGKCREVALTDIQAVRIAKGEMRWPQPEEE